MVRPADDERPAVEIPPLVVEVAVPVNLKIPFDARSPPVSERPADAANVVAEIPPENVEVAVPVLSILLESFKLETLSPSNVEVAPPVWSIAPPLMVRPADDERPAVEIPPLKLDVAVGKKLIPPELPIESMEPGDDVPTPTFPFINTAA